MLIVISDERENNRDTPPREVWPPAASQTADARFGSPGSRRGDTAGPPSVTGASSAYSVSMNLGGTAEGLPFVPRDWDGGHFILIRNEELGIMNYDVRLCRTIKIGRRRRFINSSFLISNS